MRISDGSSDVCSSDLLANGAAALAGMVRQARQRKPADSGKPGLGLTMFGVTTKAVQQIAARLEDRYDCLVFHATGVGGRSLEKLAASGRLAAAIGLPTNDVCDMLLGQLDRTGGGWGKR